MFETDSERIAHVVAFLRALGRGEVAYPIPEARRILADIGHGVRESGERGWPPEQQKRPEA